jgi:hypothetical protein
MFVCCVQDLLEHFAIFALHFAHCTFFLYHEEKKEKWVVLPL